MQNAPENLDSIYQQLETEFVDIEKRIKMIEMMANHYNQEIAYNYNIDDQSHEEILMKHRLKKLQNLYFLNMIDCNSNLLEKEGHFYIFYQILEYTNPGNLANIMIDLIDNEPDTTREDFCISFFESFGESIMQNDPNIKKAYQSVTDMEYWIYKTKTDIKSVLENNGIKNSEQKVKILFNALNYLFSNNVLDKNLHLNEEKAVQDVIRTNPFEGNQFLLFILPLKDIFCQLLIDKKSNIR